MSFESYFERFNFGNYDTKFGNVSSWRLPLFSDYSFVPLFSFGTSLWGGYSLGGSKSFDGFQSYASKTYDFSSLSTSYRSSYSARPSVASAPIARNSGKTSYKPVSAGAQKNLGPEFLAKVKEVAKNINCDYQDLLAVMNSESGLDPSIQNQAGYQAYGLIQFTLDAARDVGTTVDKLVKMSAVEQMDYVEKFYLNARKTRGFGNKKFTAADLYAVTFLPARANRDVLCVKGEVWESGKKKGQLKNWYEANSAFDKDGNNKIEKWELQERMNACRVNENIFVA